MKISIVGAGAMGSLYGSALASTGHDVVLYDINEEHVQAINSSGMVVEEARSDKTTVSRPQASTDPEAVTGSDVVIIFVKSTATEAVAKQFSSLLGEKGIVITLQNGVGNEAILKRYFGESRTAAGVTSQGATFLGPGRIRHAGKGPTHLCMSDNENSKLDDFVAALNEAGFETHIEENIDNLIWSKLVINVGINGLTALTGLHNGELLNFDETKELIRELVDEAVQVVRAKGLTLTYDNPVEMVYSVCEKTGGNRSSMLQDFDRGSRSEIDFINFAVVREAEERGIPAPVNLTVARLVKTYDHIHGSGR